MLSSPPNPIFESTVTPIALQSTDFGAAGKPLEANGVISLPPLLQNEAENDSDDSQNNISQHEEHSLIQQSAETSPGAESPGRSSSDVPSLDDSRDEICPPDAEGTTVAAREADAESLDRLDSLTDLRGLVGLATAYEEVAAQKEEEARAIEEAAIALRNLLLQQANEAEAVSEVVSQAEEQGGTHDGDPDAGHDASDAASIADPISRSSTPEPPPRIRVTRNPDQRMGVKKVVGGDSIYVNDVVVGDTHYQSTEAELVLAAAKAPGTEKRTVLTTKDGGKQIVSVDIPDFDFGVTISHDPLTTRGPLTKDALTSTKLRKDPPADEKRQPRKKSHADGRQTSGQPEGTLLWRPGLGAAPGVSRRVDTAEEQPMPVDPVTWVHQHCQKRTGSMMGLRSLSPSANGDYRSASPGRASNSQASQEAAGTKRTEQSARDTRRPISRSTFPELPMPDISRPQSREQSTSSDSTRKGTITSADRSSYSSIDGDRRASRRLSRGKLLGAAIHGNPSVPASRPDAPTQSPASPALPEIIPPPTLGDSPRRQGAGSAPLPQDATVPRYVYPPQPLSPRHHPPVDQNAYLRPPSRPDSRTALPHHVRKISTSQGLVQPNTAQHTRNVSTGLRPISAHSALLSRGSLSASEQEFIARKTGSSFFNMSAGNAKPSLREHGGVDLDSENLVGTIDLREREREIFKKTRGQYQPVDVAAAIAERQAYFSKHRPQTSISTIQPITASRNSIAYLPEQQQPQRLYSTTSQSAGCLNTNYQWAQPYAASQLNSPLRPETAAYFASQVPEPQYLPYPNYHAYRPSQSSYAESISSSYSRPETGAYFPQRAQTFNGSGAYGLPSVPPQSQPQPQPQPLPRHRPNPFYHPKK